VLGIFLDTETNGLNFQIHRPLEIAFKILDLMTKECLAEYSQVLLTTPEEWQKSDPESLRLNGFAWTMVAQGKPRERAAEEIKAVFEKVGVKRGQAVFICQNPSFDRAFFAQLINADVQEKLSWPYHWLDLASMYWAESLRAGRKDPVHYPWVTGISKDKIAAHYRLPAESKPHRAAGGVEHLVMCYEAVVGFPSSR
jgi:DNA polymerase III, epsilon subunit and related 3''-5'' exonucleases